MRLLPLVAVLALAAWFALGSRGPVATPTVEPAQVSSSAAPWACAASLEARAVDAPTREAPAGLPLDLPGAVGAGHTPVATVATPRATLVVRVSDPAGIVSVGAHLELTALEVSVPAPVLNYALRSGEVRIPDLRAGSYAMTVRWPGHLVLETTLELAPGTRTELPLVLDPFAGDGRVAVVLESASGDFHGQMYMLLTPLALDEVGLEWEPKTARVAWEQVGARWLGACAFEGLPAGEYEVSPRGGRFHCWAPGTVRTRADGDPVGLRLLDRGNESDLLLRVFDGESGAWLDGYALELTGRGCGKHFTFSRAVQQGRAQRDAPALSGVPPSVDVQWCVTRAGYERACGDLEAFTPPERVDGRLVRVMDVHLARAR